MRGHRHRAPHHWILDPMAAIPLVCRRAAEGWVEALAARRGERVGAEPFEAIELAVGVFFRGRR